MTKLDDITVKKLEEAFAMDCTVGEACLFAGISRQTYYTWIKENPELLDRFEHLRETPVLKARSTIIKGLDNVGIQLLHSLLCDGVEARPAVVLTCSPFRSDPPLLLQPKERGIYGSLV